MKTENNQTKKYQSLTKGLGIAGLVLGILTLLISFIPVLGMFALFFGFIAVIISLIGLVIALKNNHEKGLIIGAIICSLLGCGIAYSQYAVLNAVGDELIKETNIDKNETKKEKQTSQRDKDVEFVLDHINKSSKRVTDENGLPLNYEYRVEVIETKPLGKTKTISTKPIENKDKDGHANSMYAELSVSKIKYTLLINGKQIKEVFFVEHNYDRYQTNAFLDWYNTKKFSNETGFTGGDYGYAPELDPKSDLNKALSVFTKPNYYKGHTDEEKKHSSKASNDYINATSDLIKSSNILNIKTIEDFEKAKANMSEEKKKVEKENKRNIINKEANKSKKLLIAVDNLRVRTSPDLDAEKLENLPLNTVVEYLDKKSENKTEVTIKGKKINEYWYQIKTPSGNIGWIHGCCFEEK